MREVYEPTLEDLKHCKKCQHHSLVNNTRPVCVFILDTGIPRGCKFGVGCIRFVKGAPVSRNTEYTIKDPVVKERRNEESRKRIEMIGYRGDALKRMRIKE